MSPRRRLVFAGAILALPPLASQAQVRASEAATVSQTIDGTVVTITYSRPQARGRGTLFGTLVPFGRPWTPGANWATTLEVTKAVSVNGRAVPEGKYSVWAVPDASEWTILLDPEARRFHTQRPSESDDQIRFAATPDSSAHTEVLTWDFPAVRTDGATLRFRWGTTALSLNIAVESTGRGWRPSAFAAYLGTYRVRLATAGPDDPPIRADLFEEDDSLRLRLTPNPLGDADDAVTLEADGEREQFRPVFRGADASSAQRLIARVVFTLEGGRASGFLLLDREGKPWGTATREQ